MKTSGKTRVPARQTSSETVRPSTETVRLTGTIGSDWLRKQGVNPNLPEGVDALLRDWRDYIEGQLARQGFDPDFNIGNETHFAFIGIPERHTIIEIESFARKALDRFLDKRARS